ncbi:MAG TPA: AMP-binding protein [Mycobacteriales bacterium]|nr:AMP-binding protein [Mycobacteriales bacterium]
MAVELATKPTGTSLQQLAEQSWQRLGPDALLIFEGETHTSGELARRTRRLAQGLVTAGLQPGDRVVLCMANCPEVGIAYNAIWRAGGVTTPVLFLLSDDELRHVLADSAAAFVVTTPDFLAKVQAAGAGLDTLRGVILATGEAAGTLSYAELESAEEGTLVERDPAEMAALLYTGGTTGRSKGVMLSHDAMSAAAWAAVTRSHDPELNVALTPLPLSHAYGLLVSTLGLHAPEPSDSILMRWFDPAGWVELAVKHRVTLGAVVPSMLQMLLSLPLEEYDLSSLRRLTSGGAPLLAETRAELARRLPDVEVMEGYGMTETAALISSSPPGAVRAGAVGIPVPGVELRLEKPDGTVAETGEDGEICVRGPVLMTGYWRSPEATAETIRDGWLHTGDVGRLDADGYLYVVDRLKDLIIRGGINVYPRDIEDAMLTHPDVVACGVVGKPDPTYGEEVVAFVQLRPGAAVDAAALVEWARGHINKAKYPREVRIVDAIPLTSVFKTDRKAMRKLL